MLWQSNVRTKLVFFFQAEDGIRDLYVTGVQTCALPISEGREVVLADQRDRGRPHPLQVERARPGEHEPSGEGIGTAGVVDAVHVGPPPRREAGVEALRRPRRLAHHDRWAGD